MDVFHGVVSDAFARLHTLVHPTLYPFLLGQTIHAFRVSMAFQSAARCSPTHLSWGQWIVGYMMTTWGGGLFANLLLGLPQSTLYDTQMVFNYIFVHLLATAFFKQFPHLLYPAMVDTVLWPLDALLRTNGVIGMVDITLSSKVHPEYRTSFLTPLIIGAIVCSGGGVLVGTISGTSAKWTFNTPPFLREGASWDVTLDMWGGALVSLVYSILIGHPAFSSIGSYLGLGKPLSRPAAKVYALIIWATLFAAKAYKVHWIVPPKVKRTNSQVRVSEKDESRMKIKSQKESK